MDIDNAVIEFRHLIEEELKRVEKIKNQRGKKDFSKKENIIIGILEGDGIGPFIMEQALRILNYILQDEIENKKIEIRIIKGMTIEKRLKSKNSLPEDVLSKIKECDVILKGPMTTPRAGGDMPNLISGNSLLRRELDLYAAIRPVKIKDKGIDWTFFRENIEGEYILGNKGILVDNEIAVDFKIASYPNTKRLFEYAFKFAKENGKTNLTVVTKANIVKLVDGSFIKTAYEVGENYPEIKINEKYVDALASKIRDREFTKDMEIVVLPNLYGDIVTDIAAEYQGGLSSGGASSNIGDVYGVFEASHGTAPDLVSSGKAMYANPSSLFRAISLMLGHIGLNIKKEKLDKALDICTIEERKYIVGMGTGNVDSKVFTDYVLEVLNR